MNASWLELLARWLRSHSPLRSVTYGRFRPSYLAYRYRYLLMFTVIGFLSILVEVVLVQKLMPSAWSWLGRTIPAFVIGLLFSFTLNAYLNFNVSRAYIYRAFKWFAAISILSFCLNLAAIYVFRQISPSSYGLLRFVSAGSLFLIAYSLHRRFTFENARDFGPVLYAVKDANPDALFATVGEHCDFIHVDLVDETMSPGCRDVRVDVLDEVRQLWKHVPLCLHVMSRRARFWTEQTWEQVDWFLYHPDGDDDLLDLIWECRGRGKRVGVVWHAGTGQSNLLPYLMHVDLVVVLGSARCGESGQTLLPEALDMARRFDALRGRYGYHLMFDGGVTPSNVRDIPAKFVVSHSAVLRAQNPIRLANLLMTGGRYERD